jgi:hypothetical protein
MNFPWRKPEDPRPEDPIPEDPIGERRVLIDALHDEVDRQRGFVAQRSSAMANRASALVASAGIITGLQASTTLSVPFLFSIFCAGAAVILGVLVLIPRFGGELGIEQTETDYWNDRDTEAIRNLTKAKLGILRADELALKRRRKLILAGFIFLAASICASAVHVITTAICT